VIWPLLRTRRWLGFTAVVVGAILAFGFLSHWQWSRAEERRAERVALQSALAADPTPLASLDPSGLNQDEWQTVSVRGRYLPDLQAGVRKRPLDTRNGFWLMSPMETTTGSLVWINRGWLPAGKDALSTPDFPPPPGGTVTVTGHLRLFEEADPRGNQGLPEGQIAAPAPELLPAAGESLPAYVQLSTSEPEQDGLVVLPLPEVDEGRNISYAIQWLLFAGVALGGWFFFLRREAREDADRAAADVVVASGVEGSS
jgi:cytochrome oxidase assembly protein ShyY1